MKLGSGICPVPDAAARRRQRRARHRRHVLERRQRHVRDAEDWRRSCTSSGTSTTRSGSARTRRGRWRPRAAPLPQATRDGLGRIEPGRRADLVLLDLDTLPFTPLNDALRQLVLGSTTLAVDSVLVGGRSRCATAGSPGSTRRRSSPRPRARGAEIVGRHDEAFEIGRSLLASRSRTAGSRRCGPTSASSASSRPDDRPRRP